MRSTPELFTGHPTVSSRPRAMMGARSIDEWRRYWRVIRMQLDGNRIEGRDNWYFHACFFLPSRTAWRRLSSACSRNILIFFDLCAKNKQMSLRNFCCVFQENVIRRFSNFENKTLSIYVSLLVIGFLVSQGQVSAWLCLPSVYGFSLFLWLIGCYSLSYWLIDWLIDVFWNAGLHRSRNAVVSANRGYRGGSPTAV